MNMKNNQTKTILYPILIILAIVLIYSFIPKGTAPKSVSVSEISQDVTKGEVKQIDVKDNLITATLNDNSKVQASKEASATLKDYGITPDKVQINVTDTTGNTALYSILSIVLLASSNRL